MVCIIYVHLCVVCVCSCQCALELHVSSHYRSQSMTDKSHNNTICLHTSTINSTLLTSLEKLGGPGDKAAPNLTLL